MSRSIAILALLLIAVANSSLIEVDSIQNQPEATTQDQVQDQPSNPERVSLTLDELAAIIEANRGDG